MLQLAQSGRARRCLSWQLSGGTADIARRAGSCSAGRAIIEVNSLRPLHATQERLKSRTVGDATAQQLLRDPVDGGAVLESKQSAYQIEGDDESGERNARHREFSFRPPLHHDDGPAHSRPDRPLILLRFIGPEPVAVVARAGQKAERFAETRAALALRGWQPASGVFPLCP